MQRCRSSLSSLPFAGKSWLRCFSAQGAAEKVGVVMMNMGGPSSLEGESDGVGTFLNNLFSDNEIINLGPLQNTLGPWISKRRTPKIIEQYSQIGGKSPILDWTKLQGSEMEKKLNEVGEAEFKHYVAFRYAPPLTEESLLQMKEDGTTRAIAFSQYPHYSCTTTGSSMNHLWRELRRLGLQDAFKWSVIDRWPTHPTFIRAVTNRVNLGLQQFPEDVRDKVIILFTAHSLPMKVVAKGDPYPQEIGATVQSVMESLDAPHNYLLAWQSKVGYLPWLQPSTSEVIEGLARQGHKYVMTVPIAFTSDHIETLFEIDIEYAEEAEKHGIEMFKRAPSLNDEPLLSTAQAEIVMAHYKSGEASTKQYAMNCAGCVNPTCRTILNPISSYCKLRDSYEAPSSVPSWP